MIRHIVLWRVREADGLSREQNAERMKAALLAMRERIPGIVSMEAGTDISGEDQSSDVALCMEFEDREALERYRDHPVHREFIKTIDGFRTERRVVDFEM